MHAGPLTVGFCGINRVTQYLCQYTLVFFVVVQTDIRNETWLKIDRTTIYQSPGSWEIKRREVELGFHRLDGGLSWTLWLGHCDLDTVTRTLWPSDSTLLRTTVKSVITGVGLHKVLRAYWLGPHHRNIIMLFWLWLTVSSVFKESGRTDELLIYTLPPPPHPQPSPPPPPPRP